MGYIVMWDTEGRHLTIRVPSQPVQNFVNVGVPEPTPARVYPIHHRPNVSADVIQLRPRSRKVSP